MNRTVRNCAIFCEEINELILQYLPKITDLWIHNKAYPYEIAFSYITMPRMEIKLKIPLKAYNKIIYEIVE